MKYMFCHFRISVLVLRPKSVLCLFIKLTTLQLTVLGFTLFATSEDSGDRLASVVIRDGQDTYYLHPTVRAPIPRYVQNRLSNHRSQLVSFL
jgi:hypothetical protein